MQIQASLKQVTLFSRLSDQALDEISTVLKSRQLSAGEILFNKDDPGDNLVIVQAGKVAIFEPIEGSPGKGQPIRIFQKGEMLGEMALIDQKPRSLSARAESPATIFTLSGEDFRRALTQNPEMSLSVMAGLNDRIRYTTDFLSEVRLWIRRIAAADYQSQGMVAASQYKDQNLASLAEEFARMAAQVQEREESLRREVAQLRIEIDEAKRKQEADRIMGTDYYKSLKERAKLLRQQGE